MREEDSEDMLDKSNDHTIRELRNILADFKSSIEKEKSPFKHIGRVEDQSQKPA